MTQIDPIQKWVHNMLAAAICICGGSHSTQPFCNKCGDANPRFDKAAFEAEDGLPIEQAILTECGAGHPDMHKGIQDDPYIHKEYPFCGYCGARVCQ